MSSASRLPRFEPPPAPSAFRSSQPKIRDLNPANLMSVSYDLIVIGGGHNGLVTAAYAARAGLKALVLERREVLGGACVTEEVWPGYKVSTAAYVNSLLRPEIIRDLELHASRLRDAAAEPVVVHALPRRALAACSGPDKALTHREISKFSAKDAEALPKYEAMLERVADFLEPTLMMTPPNPWSLRPGEPGAARQARARLRQARHRRPEGGRDPDRRRDADPRPLVRERAAQGHARDRRDHRRDGLALDAGHGLRAVPPRDGRVQRRAGRVGLRARRHGRDQQRIAGGRAGARRRDPHERRGGRGSW